MRKSKDLLIAARLAWFNEHARRSDSAVIKWAALGVLVVWAILLVAALAG